MDLKMDLKKYSKVLSVLPVLGLIILAFGNIISIGYGLYLWGVTEITFSLAVWLGFKLWITMIVSGIVLFILGLPFKN